MVEILKIPTILTEPEALGEAVRLHIPASFEEYVGWVEKCGFKMTDSFEIMGHKLTLAEMYKDMEFEK